MDKIEIIMQALNALVPNAQYIIRENFDGLEWKDKRTVPTESAVKAKYDEIVAAQPLNELRQVRNSILAQSDWMTLADSPTMSDDWKTYRQKLRDITKTYKSLSDVKWPEKP